VSARARYPSAPEGRLARRALLRAVPPAVAAIAVQVCRARLHRGLVQLGTSERDASRIVTWSTVLLAAFAIARILQFLYHLARWRRARHWERMLEDPARAARVPPLAAHTDALRHQQMRGGRVQGYAVTVAVVCGLVVTTSIVPAESSADRTDLTRSQQVGLIIATAVALAVAGIIAVQRWRRARHAEHLSDDPSLGAPPANWIPGTTEIGRPRHPVREEVGGAAPALTVTTEAPPLTTRVRTAMVTSTTNVFAAEPWEIVYLRLFDNDDRLREVLQGPWRACGRVLLMRAATSVSEEEIERARRGEPMFINSHEWLQRVLDADGRPLLAPGKHELTEIAATPVRVSDPFGSYAPLGLLVHGSFWQEALEALLDRADVVLLDLSGYRRENVGTGYEIQRVVDRWPIEHCLFLLDAESDAAFLEAQLRDAWSRMLATSPNAHDAHRVLMCRTGGSAGDEHALAAALQLQLRSVETA
jgi:hypothetical protein